jgi:lipid-binding SYLF domain-containing protein
MFNCIRYLVAALGLAGLLGTSASALASEQSDLVAAAQKAFADMRDDPDMTWFRDNLKNARAVLISPEIVKAGFVLGGSGGRGVLLAKDAATGRWEGPAFYNLATASIGFQAGIAKSEAVMLVMTDKAFNSFLSNKFKLGGDASVAAGPVGAGAQSDIKADVYTFSRSKGLYGGLNLDGTMVTINGKWNQAYYGKPVTPVDILVRHSATNPGSGALIEEVANAAK